MRTVLSTLIRRTVVAAGLAAAVCTLAPSASAFVWPNVPDQIARALTSGDVNERRIAAQRLRDLPAEMAVKLVQIAMGDPDTEVRVRGAEAAIALKIPKAGDLVIPWLSENDSRLRLAACDTIRVAPTDRSVVALGRVLDDPDVHVRVAAAAAMGASTLPDAVAPLLRHLDDTAPEARAEVARALGRIGDLRAVVPLIGKVQDSVPEVRKTVSRALGDLADTRATSALMLALTDASMDVRLSAVEALGKIRSDEATPAVTALLEARDTTDPNMYAYRGGPIAAAPTVGASEVRDAAIRALGRIGSDAAVKALIGVLSEDDSLTGRSAVREALVEAGKPAATALITLLGASPTPSAAAGAALVLGTLKAPESEKPITLAMQRGTVPLRHGLRALAMLGSPTALPTVLEQIDDPDPTVRIEAIRTASSLLDPAKPDGRAVDPAREALKDAATPMDERIELVKLLGRTGSPRAHEVLLPLAKAKSLGVRSATIEALGVLRAGAPAVDEALLEALNDEQPDIRQKAAMALARVGTAAAAGKLLERLNIAAEQDRGAIGLALSGSLARATDAKLAERVAASISSAPDIARDALIEGLGRMPGDAAGKALASMASGSVDDRRKVAEALAGHAEQSAVAVKFLADADAGVRANAAWSLGHFGKKENIAQLAALLKDPDVAVAGNAAAALGRIGKRDGAAKDVSTHLCAATSDTRSYVRANALTALSIAGASCDTRIADSLLSRDASEAVRLAAADFLGRSIAAGTDDGSGKRALLRCASEERNATVASRCAKPLATSAETDDLVLYVVPDMRSTPLARTPFTLIRPDGLLRLGLADRRGEVFERAMPHGTVRLGVPPSLAK
ncbi:MAG: HEAT repeat domain-containing protein [Polyangiaceae bacterium]|nr:HEAT repeat domain-containing protein [Polyangiaceae bacterium]